MPFQGNGAALGRSTGLLLVWESHGDSRGYGYGMARGLWWIIVGLWEFS